MRLLNSQPNNPPFFCGAGAIFCTERRGRLCGCLFFNRGWLGHGRLRGSLLHRGRGCFDTRRRGRLRGFLGRALRLGQHDYSCNRAAGGSSVSNRRDRSDPPRGRSGDSGCDRVLQAFLGFVSCLNFGRRFAYFCGSRSGCAVHFRRAARARGRLHSKKQLRFLPRADPCRARCRRGRAQAIALSALAKSCST